MYVYAYIYFSMRNNLLYLYIIIYIVIIYCPYAQYIFVSTYKYTRPFLLIHMWRPCAV